MGGVVEVDKKARDRLRGDAGGGFEFGRGPCCERRADHAVAGLLPGITCGVEREGLAGPGWGDHDIDTVAAGSELHDEVHLLGGQFGPATQRVEHDGLVDDTDVAVSSADGMIDESLFEGHQLLGRVERPERGSVDGSAVGTPSQPRSWIGCQHDDCGIAESPVGELLDAGDIGAISQPVTPRARNMSRRSNVLARAVSPPGPRSSPTI